MAEEGQTDNQRRERAADQTKKHAEGEILFPNPAELGDPLDVNFDARLEKSDNRFFLRDVSVSGLAHAAGYRSGDVLVMVNTKGDHEINAMSLQDLLSFMRDYVTPDKLIGVERTLDGDRKTYIWVIFKIEVTGDVPSVVVVETLNSDKNILPDISFGRLSFLKCTQKPYGIYLEQESKPDLYLTVSVSERKVVFETPPQKPDNNLKNSLYICSYFPDSEKGNVVALSTDDPTIEEDNKPLSPAALQKDAVEAVDFPACMTDKNKPIALNSMFWYKHVHAGEDGMSAGEGGTKVSHTLESIQNEGMFLGLAHVSTDGTYGAVLKNEPTIFTSVDE